MAQNLNPKHAVTAAASLEAYITQLEKQKGDLDERIADAKEALRAMQRQCPSAAVASGARRKKGENLRKIRELFENSAVHSLALTANQIAERLQIQPSSVQNALRKNQPEFSQGEDGLWRRRGAS